MRKKSLWIALSTALLTVSLSLASLSMVRSQSAACASTEDYLSFLNDRYGIDLTGEIDQEQFTAAAVTLVGEVETPQALDLDGFTGLEAVLYALYYANLDELAYTYPEAKVTEALQKLDDVSAALPLAHRQELAAAIDAGLLNTDCVDADALASPVSGEFAGYVLGQVLELTGRYENFFGYTTDPDIYSRLIYAWNAFNQVLQPEITGPANQLIRDGVITGYNVKRTTLNADFNSELSIVYGHANINHARQLIALLRSEDIMAKVLLEPKTSAFLYLAEWGEPTASPEFQIEPLDDGNYIAYAKEFDLAFEFSSIEDRDRFDEIIKAYAKKDEDNEPGLIVGSWWQPLYSSRVELPEYIAVVNNVAFIGDFYIQSFSLVEKSDAVLEGFRAAYPDGDVQVWDLWVNQAFYNYLIGLPT
jgi:hypothetical protein